MEAQNHHRTGNVVEIREEASGAQAAFDEFGRQVRHPFDPTESDSIQPNQTNPP